MSLRLCDWRTPNLRGLASRQHLDRVNTRRTKINEVVEKSTKTVEVKDEVAHHPSSSLQRGVNNKVDLNHR